jgi:hypothetical protein
LRDGSIGAVASVGGRVALAALTFVGGDDPVPLRIATGFIGRVGGRAALVDSVAVRAAITHAEHDTSA